MLNRVYSKNPALGYQHMVQLLIFLKNLKVLLAARKEGTRNHCLKKCFVQQVSKTFIPRVFVSGSAQLFPCFEVICDICCRNLHQCVQLVPTWAVTQLGLLHRWGSGKWGIYSFLEVHGLKVNLHVKFHNLLACRKCQDPAPSFAAGQRECNQSWELLLNIPGSLVPMSPAHNPLD